MEKVKISKLPSTLNPNNEILYSDQSPPGKVERNVTNYKTAVSNSHTEQKIDEGQLKSFDQMNTFDKSDSKGSSPRMRLNQHLRMEGDKSGSNQSQELSTISALPPKPNQQAN